MFEEVLFKNRRPDRPATLDEYRQSGGYEALIKAVKERTPEEVLPAMTQIPWLMDLPRFGRQALWGANNSGTVFSGATLNLALMLLLVAAALAGWQRGGGADGRYE